MVGPVLFVLLAVFALVVAVLVSQVRQKEAQAFAASLGFQYSKRDNLGIGRLRHRVLNRGDRQRFENLVYGEFEGNEVTLFDFTYYQRTHDSKGMTRETSTSLSAARLLLPASLPPIDVSREGFLTRMANAMGIGKDVQFEWEEFNREYRIRCSDQRFAFMMVDSAMMHWLMDQDSRYDLEILGSDLLVVGKRLKWPEMTTLLEYIGDFKAQIPRLVWDSYETEK